MGRIVWITALAGVICWSAATAQPRYIEQLRIGGGQGDPLDGGANLEADGHLHTDGPVEAERLRAAAAQGQEARLELFSGGDAEGASIWYDGAGGALVFGLRDGDVQDVPALFLPAASAAPAALERSLDVAGKLRVHGMIPRLGGSRLRALWHCEDAAPVLDWAGRGNDAACTGSVSTGEGVFGRALVFSGGSAEASSAIPQELGAADATFTLWLRSDGGSSDQHVLGWYDSSATVYLQLLVATGGQIVFRCKGGDGSVAIASSEAVNDGSWRHVTAVREYGGELRLYINGRLSTSGSDAAGDATPPSYRRFMMGAATTTPYLPFAGAVDEVALWADAFTEAQAAAAYNLALEWAPIYGDRFIQGDVTARGGTVAAGAAGTERGVLKAHEGAGGQAPACIQLASPNGTAYYLFVADDGTLRVHSSLPAQSTDGASVGGQG
jgi:hypothetical protein